jgi:hypothetical protein
VFTARYALSSYIKQIRFVFKRLIGALGRDRERDLCLLQQDNRQRGNTNTEARQRNTGDFTEHPETRMQGLQVRNTRLTVW